MNFLVKRIKPDDEGIFIAGDTYTATITEMDFKYKGEDSMEVYVRDERVDIECLWSTKDFSNEFAIVG